METHENNYDGVLFMLAALILIVFAVYFIFGELMGLIEDVDAMSTEIRVGAFLSSMYISTFFYKNERVKCAVGFLLIAMVFGLTLVLHIVA